MKKLNKLMTAAIAGIMSASFAGSTLQAEEAKAKDAKPAAEKHACKGEHGCKGDHACKGKGACKGEHGCKGKDGCKGHKKDHKCEDMCSKECCVKARGAEKKGSDACNGPNGCGGKNSCGGKEKK